MSFYQDSPQLLEVAKQYQADVTILKDLAKERQLNLKFNLDLNIDHRDFLPLVLMDEIPETSPEARKEILSQRLTDICDAFADPDISKREPYLKKMFDLRDSFQPNQVDMSDPVQVRQLIATAALSQTYAVKRDENPEYFDRRYPTAADKNYDRVANHYLDAVCSVVLSKLYDQNFVLDPGPSLPYRMDASMQPYLRSLCEYAQEQLTDAERMRAGEPSRDHFFLTVPNNVLGFADVNPQNIGSLSNKMQTRAWDFVTLCLDTSFLQGDSKDLSLLKEGHLTPRASLFIDGKPLKEFTRELFPDKKSIAEAENCLSISMALLSPKHRVEMVRCVRGEDGSMVLEPKEIRQRFSPQQEQQHLKQNYSWLRRTLFNWGPFRIPTLQEQADALAANDVGKEARHEQIVNKMRDTLQTSIAEVQEKARIAQQKEAEAARLLTAVKGEKQKLSDHVEQWDKESAIGQLGQQVKNGYDNIMSAFGTSGSKRAAIVREGLAQLVLYDRLCQERAGNNNQPGNMELQLRGDGSPEQLQENIRLATADIAANKDFQALLQSKCPDLTRTKFEKSIITNGGYERFSQEYMMKLQGVTQETVMNEPSHTRNHQKEAENTVISIG